MVMAGVKSSPAVEAVRQHLEVAAVEGFRTLCFADKVLSEEEEVIDSFQDSCL